MGVQAKNPFEDGELYDKGIDLSGGPDQDTAVEVDEAADEPGLTGPILTEIDHIAIAVTDLDEAIEDYRETFGATVDHRETVESDGVEEALLKVAESYVQLLAPTTDVSPVAKYLAKKGPGLHHIGYRVANCAAALDAVKAQGHRVIDDHPRPGSRGTTVAFVHPKSLHGVLIELVQE